MFNPSNETHFSLTVEDYVGDLQVLSFTGTEGISQPYRFDLELVSENPDLDLEKAPAQAGLFLAFDPKGSGIHGQIYRVAQGDAGKRLTRYKVSLVPQLQYLHHRTNQRIYQQMSAPKIIALILEEHGIKGNAYKFQLSQPCPDRDYCVQYDETDLHFVQRLCEEEGIHYHFQHTSKGHLLVFGDDQTVFPKLGQPTAYVQGSGMVADEPVIKGFKLRLETRTSRTTRRDYDFEKNRACNWKLPINLMFRAKSRTSKTTTTPAASSTARAANSSANAPSNATAPTTSKPKAMATRPPSSAATSWKSPTTRAPSGTTSGCSPKSSTKANSRKCSKKA